METFTGSFGKHQFNSKSEVNAFNSEAYKWFLERGFTPDTSTTFQAVLTNGRAMAGSSDWKQPGVLLCRPYDVQNRIYVFIPECYHPESNLQIIGYHVSSRGTCEEVIQRRQEFESLQKEYRSRFPDSRAAQKSGNKT